MKWFNREKNEPKTVAFSEDKKEFWAGIALNKIREGVILTDNANIIRFLNPAALAFLNLTAETTIGVEFQSAVKILGKNGEELVGAENLLYNMVNTGQSLERFQAMLVAWQNQKRTLVEFNVVPIEQGEIITFRDIASEIEEEGAQMEFISTASHEMRTPVASMEGYLSLALNPQTATIDERARGYIEAAHAAAKHLGDLFRDLLDTTKMDDGKMQMRIVPVEMVSEVKKISDSYVEKMNEKKIKYQFGSDSGLRKIDQLIYGAVDLEFLREIVGNLVDNAIKYTPEEGSIRVDVTTSNGQALISVMDSGIGIAPDDLQHVFQKFYRADNSDTRTVGGTGLGLYLVKKRAEMMGGRVWAESVFREGSTFFVSLPQISSEEYERQKFALNNNLNGGQK